MASRTATIDRLFDRSSRLPYALRSRTRPGRRWSMLGLFILLSTLIGVYSYLTDASRVRDKAEQYLTELTGARVVVGRATLSIFEGLRLDDIRLYADPLPAKSQATGPGARAGEHPAATPVESSPIFSASRFQITYSVRQMLRGRIDGTRIVATDPHVLIAQDLDTGVWNYQRLRPPAAASQKDTGSPAGPAEPLRLPEVVLRDARVDYVETRGRARSLIGSMSLEGHLIATPGGDRYVFTLQSRGLVQGKGPSVSGSMDIASGKIVAQLSNFAFGTDIETMLPAPVREWWEDHALTGELDVPSLVYAPATADRPITFRVETNLKGVQLTVHPNEWLSHDEQAYTQSLHDALMNIDAFQRRIGYTPAKSPSAESSLAALLDAQSIRLQNVAGGFVFTNHGIEIDHAAAQPLPEMNLVLSGHIDGYSPDAPLSLVLRSDEQRNLIIPETPPYVGSMPGPVRELFLQLKPAGEAKLQISVNRDEAGDPIVAAGEIDVIRGQFQYEKFPYPVREATGKIEFGPDPKTHIERLALTNLRGKGLAGGPNENANMQLNGLIAPLSPDAGIAIKVEAEHFIFEPAMQQALPTPVREVIELFEPPRHPELLYFAGGFVCRIDRPVGHDRDVYISTDLRIDDASGEADVFPYPLHHVKGLIQVRDDHADIINVHAEQGDQRLRVDGHVAWTPHHDHDGDPEWMDHPPIWLKTDIHLAAENIPIDQTLMDALPGNVKFQLLPLGLSGILSFDGTLQQRPIIEPTGEVDSPMRYDLALHVRDGGIQPYGGQWAAGHMTGDIYVSPEIVRVTNMSGTRGAAAISGSGYMDLTQRDPPLVVRVAATNLTLDQPFYQLISSGGRETWNEVHPAGTIDLDLAFNQPGHDFEMTARPRELSVKPDEFPLAMDHLSGVVHVLDNDVTFTNVQARHGDSSLWANGTGRLDKTDWDLKMAGRNLTIDKELLAALPTQLQGMAAVVGIKGKAAIDFSQFRLVAPSTQPALPIDPATEMTANEVAAMNRFAPYAASTMPSVLPVARAKASPMADVASAPAGSPTTVPTAEERPSPPRQGDALASSQPASPVTEAAALPRRDEANQGITVSAPDENGHWSSMPTTRPTAAVATIAPAVDPTTLTAFTASLWLDDASMNLGVPIDHCSGLFKLNARVEDGHLSLIDGIMDAWKLNLVGRDVTDFHAHLMKHPDQLGLRLDDIHAGIGDGTMAGRVDLLVGDGSFKYVLNLSLHNADVQTLTQETDGKIQGRLSASLALEGPWNNRNAVRGRGDVSVTGQQIAKLPLLLGLFQIANLALPVTGPLNEATARYSIDGPIVTFERVTLRGNNVLMTGDGRLDFNHKTVDMRFSNDNPSAFKIPFIGDLIESANRELLQIHVKGSVLAPKVSSSTFGTISTTVDEVLSGDDEQSGSGGKR